MNWSASVYLVQKIPLTDFTKKLRKSIKNLLNFSRSTSIFQIFPPKINGNIGINSWNSTDLAGILLTREEVVNSTDMSEEFTTKYKLAEVYGYYIRECEMPSLSSQIHIGKF